jgi:hypothetical protein
MSDAELNFGSLSSDTSENMKEIGELGLDIWKSMVGQPLTTSEMFSCICLVKKSLKQHQSFLNQLVYQKQSKRFVKTSRSWPKQTELSLNNVVTTYLNQFEPSKTSNCPA